MPVPDQFQFVDNNQDVRIAGSLVDQGATEGDVLTVNADGSISAAAGGGGIPDPVTTPISVDLNDPTVFAQTFDYSGTDDWEGALLVNVKDQTMLVGDAYVLRVVDAATGNEIFDLDAYGSMLMNGAAGATAGVAVNATSGGVETFRTTSDGRTVIRDAGGNTLLDAESGQIGFFGSAAAKAAAPSTLGDVIAILQAFGFCS